MKCKTKSSPPVYRVLTHRFPRAWGQVFVIIDVLSRSRVYLDEMYEVLASAVEKARPKVLYMYVYICIHVYV